MIVDAHQHFWDPARGDYAWLRPDNPIHRVFAPADLKPLLDETGVEGSILVQAAPTTAETDYMLGIARTTPWVLGVVGWVDLLAPDAVGQIRTRASDPLFVGLRPMLQDLPDSEWILRPGLAPALEAIAAEGLIFDALILAHQVKVITELAERHPQLPIILDHGAKPQLGDADAMLRWGRDMEALAAMPNVACKVSGLLTELTPAGTRDDVARAVAVLFDLFGAQRLVWGSDWPVLTLARGYRAWFELARDAIAAKQESAIADVMGGNALRLYRPKLRHIRA